MGNCGVYQIQSISKPDRIYIGSSRDIRGRWRLHAKNLLDNKHHSPKLQYHYNKYGAEDLQYSLLLSCNETDLLKSEQFFLDSYKHYFNVLPNAGSHLGAKRSDESRKRCSLSKMGEKHHYYGKHLSAEHKEALSKSLRGKESYWKGKTLSEEAKAKMSISRTGRKVTEETRNKISNANKGKKRSEEFRKQCSERNKLRRATEETKKKLSIAHKGRVVSEETRQKISKAHKGKKMSPEFCEKIRQINIGNKNALGHIKSPEAIAKHKISMIGKRIFSAEARMKMSIKGKGRKQSPEQIRKRMESSSKTRRLNKLKQVCQN